MQLELWFTIEPLPPKTEKLPLKNCKRSSLTLNTKTNKLLNIFASTHSLRAMKDYNYSSKQKQRSTAKQKKNKTDNDEVFGSYTLSEDYFETHSSNIFS